jgi:secondary thiamine-phosphate synthase enzyme
MITLNIRTNAKTELVDIASQVQRAVEESGVKEGICLLFVPHTTAALTLNETWDPSVRHDILLTLDERIAPPDPRHRHAEGNSPAHIKSSVFGVSAFVFVSGGQPRFGNWQGLYLAEFDGPRNRRLWLTVLATG